LGSLGHWQHWRSARYTQDCHVTMQTGESMWRVKV